MYRLLIADDVFEIRNGLSSYFPWKDIGFEIAGLAENGKQALQLLAAGPVDVLLCDIRMPVMTGIEVAKHLHAQSSPVKIVFLSGFKDFEYAKQAIVYGVKNYIVKPTQYDELSSVFQQIKLELDQERGAVRPHASGQTASVPGKETAADDHDKVISRVKAYVEEHYNKATLEEAAKLVHMNPFYLSKYFKQRTRENFSDYVNRIKMQRAASMLESLSYKIYEVSELTGYSNAKNFTRSFKKFYGISPKRYTRPE
ncbi:AraC family transcriptional regulator [Gordoniibacillus kamchatkensis]|uniref:AraC family transcriptional regulator n=1 Tax=Gordoniibacillus kamchatkensis TaxID=1590651 RepID=A0ABR5AE12_9BACL|nr:response regulator [Paenibacillus sp. VKM B-2647]KIL39185.1 AraC family transcriptional regulator [Paenibacillus sp. VKM B-2647]